MTGSDHPVQPRPNVDQALELLDWNLTMDLDEGLSRAIDYFRTALPEAS